MTKDEVAKSLGPDTKIQKLDDLSTVEIRDLDGEVTKEEVLEAVSGYDDVGAKLVSLRRTYGDSKTAVVRVPSSTATRLCAVGRLRVDLVCTRVYPIVLPTRCYMCLAFGHTVRDCSGLDRSKCCWRCGGTDHLRQDCTAF